MTQEHPSRTPWPANRVTRKPITELVPYARNARTHSPAQIDKIVASIREWGWTNPILVDEDGGIVAGHGRVLAAKKLGIDEVPVMIASGWTEAQRRAYVLADNRLALDAGWDEDLLRGELLELGELGFDLPLTGSRSWSSASCCRRWLRVMPSTSRLFQRSR